MVSVTGGPLGHADPGQMSILSVLKYGPAYSREIFKIFDVNKII